MIFSNLISTLILEIGTLATLAFFALLSTSVSARAELDCKRCQVLSYEIEKKRAELVSSESNLIKAEQRLSNAKIRKDSSGVVAASSQIFIITTQIEVIKNDILEISNRDKSCTPCF